MSESFNDNIIFGKTLVDGYLLEENHNEPSIVLSIDLEKLFNECEVKRSEYLSPFSFYWDDVRYGENEPFLNGINIMVNRLNKNSEVSDKIIAKYDWLINEYNTYFKYAIKYKLHKEIGNFYLEPLENNCWPEDFTNK